MGAPRRNNLITSRRRVDDDGGEEEGSVVAGAEDDSLSEGSAITDADDDADAEGSDASDIDISRRRATTKSRSEPDGRVEVANGTVEGLAGPKKKPSLTAATADTEAMMNGLRISGDVDEGEEMHFDDLGRQQEEIQASNVPDPTTPAQPETLAERRKREHEEYRKKRDADPAFVPNRGGFFMHDHRSSAPGQNGFRPFVKGRGRGRGTNGGPFSPVV